MFAMLRKLGGHLDNENRLTSYDGITYNYDNNGNLISKNDKGSLTAYTWDYENRLVRVDLPNGDYVEYVYDSFGKRMRKSVFGSLSSEVYYVYDNEDIIAEYSSDGTVKYDYLHGQGIDEPVQVTSRTAQVTSYYSFDGLGSVSELTDASGAVVESYEYDAFGNVNILDANRLTLNASAFNNPYMYTSREYDNETGLYFYRARYYDSTIGRFISADPLLKPRFYFFAGRLLYIWHLSMFVKAPNDLNAYIYCRNNAVNFSDPIGLFGGCGPFEPGGVADYLGGVCWTPYCIKHDCCCACGGASCNRIFCVNLFKSCSVLLKTPLLYLRCLRIAKNYCFLASMACFSNPEDCCKCKERGLWN